jgi:hypothetical protein
VVTAIMAFHFSEKELPPLGTSIYKGNVLHRAKHLRSDNTFFEPNGYKPFQHSGFRKTAHPAASQIATVGKNQGMDPRAAPVAYRTKRLVYKPIRKNLSAAPDLESLERRWFSEI